MDLSQLTLIGRRALITGAGRGIGLAIAQTLAMAGCAVAIQDIDEGVAKREADRIAGESGSPAVGLGGDATDLRIARELIDDTLAELGGLDILINNAAVQVEGSWLNLSVADIERQVRADFILPILLCQIAVPLFRDAKWGRIINVGSIQQKTGNDHMLAYSMSKAALENLTTALGRELAGHGVTVNLIAPGYIDTLRNQKNFQSEADKEKAGEGIPAKRLGQPEDCAGLALLLCSEAGSYITGQSIFVDGGLSAR